MFKNNKGFAFAGVLVVLAVLAVLVAVFFFPTNKKFQPSDVQAAEIIKRNIAKFLQPGTIYHQKYKQYVTGQPGFISYDFWQDQDSPRFSNNVGTQNGNTVWQGFNLDIRWDIDYETKVYKKDLYIYNKINPRGVNRGQMVDLAQQFDDLLQKGVLEAKIGKLDRRDVYVVYDTRPIAQRYWDILTFDKETFELLQAEKYEGEGNARHVQNLVSYEVQEALPRTDENLNKLFTLPPVPAGFKVMERHFEASNGYVESDYYEASSEASPSARP